ncbi:MAG: hypothetical protein M5R41_10470 [Bacteroidia bacterium]|nr:hypothetical protein [Bacteroidia bacterium]
MTLFCEILYYIQLAFAGLIVALVWHVLELRAMRRRMEREGYAGARRPEGERRWFTCLSRDKQTLRQI